MGGGDLNLKKSWHPGLMKNQEVVWKREQEALAERKLISERQKEIQRERERNELLAMEEAATGKKRVQRMEWMYSGVSNGSLGATDEAEAFLLGKKRVDVLFKEEEDSSIKKDTISDRFNGSGVSLTSERDQLSKERGDPMMAIKRKQMEVALTQSRLKHNTSGKTSSTSQHSSGRQKNESSLYRDRDRDRSSDRSRRHRNSSRERPSRDKDEFRDRPSRNRDHSRERSSRNRDTSREHSSRNRDTSRERSSRNRDTSRDRYGRHKDSYRERSSKYRDSSRERSYHTKDSHASSSRSGSNRHHTTSHQYSLSSRDLSPRRSSSNSFRQVSDIGGNNRDSGTHLKKLNEEERNRRLEEMKTNARELNDTRDKRMKESKRQEEVLKMRDDRERAKHP